MPECIICGHSSQESDVVPGLFFCSECNNYYFHSQKEEKYEVAKILLAVNKLSGFVFEDRSLAIAANINKNLDGIDLFYYLNKEVANYKNSLFVDGKYDSQLETVANKIAKIKYCTFEDVEYVLNSYAYAEELVKTLPVKQERTSESLIKLFSVDKTRMLKGEKVLINWQVSKNASLFINGKKEKIYGKGSKLITLKKTTVFRIEIKEKEEVIAEERTVEVVIEPRIDYFSSTKKSAFESEEITLNWKTQDADRLLLTGAWQGSVDVTGKKNMNIRLPGEDVVYTLIAQNRCASVSESVLVNVKKLPKFSTKLIKNFNFESLNVELPTIPLVSFDGELDFSMTNSLLTESQNRLLQEIENERIDAESNLFGDLLGLIRKTLEKIIIR